MKASPSIHVHWGTGLAFDALTGVCDAARENVLVEEMLLRWPTQMEESIVEGVKYSRYFFCIFLTSHGSFLWYLPEVFLSSSLGF